MQPEKSELSSENNTPAPETNWAFSGGADEAQASGYEDDISPGLEVTWTASEFISHAKGTGWYVIYGLVCVALAAGVYFMTLLLSDKRDLFTPVIIIVVAILFGVMAARKPRELEYKIDGYGVTIDKKHYPFADFKSFAVVQEEGVQSIWFIPLKRFMPGISIYFPPEEANKIVESLTVSLPIENRKLDLVDALMHKIRF